MAQFLKQLDQLLWFRGRREYAGRQFPQTVAPGRGVLKNSGRVGRIVQPNVRGGRTDPDAAVAAGNVIDQVGEGLWDAGGRMAAQPLEDLGRAPPRVVRAAQRIVAEPEDPSCSSRFLLRQEPKVVRDLMGQWPGGHRGQVGLNDDLFDRLWEQIDQMLGYRLVSVDHDGVARYSVQRHQSEPARLSPDQIHQAEGSAECPM